MATNYISQLNINDKNYLIKDNEARNNIDALNEAKNTFNGHIANENNPHKVSLTQLGVTATAAELNVLDGVTTTGENAISATHINHLSKLTTNIQSKFNSLDNEIDIMKEDIAEAAYLVPMTANGNNQTFSIDRPSSHIIAAIEEGKTPYLVLSIDEEESEIPIQLIFSREHCIGNTLIFKADLSSLGPLLYGEVTEVGYIYAILLLDDSNEDNGSGFITALELAPADHSSPWDTFGLGNTDNYGHVKLSDTMSSDLNSTQGTAITPKALHEVNTNLNNSINTLFNQITASNFQVTFTEYDGPTTLNSHQEYEANYNYDTILNEFSNGKQIYGLLNGQWLILQGPIISEYDNTPGLLFRYTSNTTYKEIILLDTLNADDRPLAYLHKEEVLAIQNHADSSNVYGLGNAANYGHLKLSDADSNTNDTTKGIAATPKAISTVKTNLQNQIDALAPKSNPTFTGAVILPTPDKAKENNQYKTQNQAATLEFVDQAINDLLEASSAMTFKGSVNSISDLPNKHDVGDTYVVATAGIYVGQTCEVGDLIICKVSGTTVNANDWIVVQTNINGAVTGPKDAIAKNLAAFDGTTGKIIEDSGISTKTVADTINTVDGLVTTTIPALDNRIQPLERADYVYLDENQALTNKTYNGYTLADACARNVDSSPVNASKKLVESGGVYSEFTNVNNEIDNINENIDDIEKAIGDMIIFPNGGGNIIFDSDDLDSETGKCEITFTSEESNNTPINAVLFIPQNLTEAEKTQAKKNLGILNTDSSNYLTREQIESLISESIERAFSEIARAEDYQF